MDTIGEGPYNGKYVPKFGKPVQPRNEPLQKSVSCNVINDPHNLHEGVPFKPCNPPKLGNHSTLDKFPRWKGDPPKEK